MTKHTRNSTLRILTTVALAVTLGGCSTPPQHEIATIKGGATEIPQPSHSAEQSRERIDMTDAELTALYEPFRECIEEKSGGGISLNGNTSSTDRPTKSELDADTAARVACADLEPLPPWEMDRKNPEAQDFMQAVVACLKDRGVTYVEVDDDPSSSSLNVAFGGPDNDPSSISKGMQEIDPCLIEVSKKR